jgi:hypothetical protein
VSAPDVNAIVAREFGPAFHAVPGVPLLTADLDGDGAEDAVIVATAKDPLLDQAGFHYKVLDPMNAYFGFGDPKVTTQFSAPGEQPRYVLVILAWRVTPKAKFVLANLPFQKISLGRVLVKKNKTLPAIKAEDRTGESFVYWAGKTWKWQDGPQNQ